MKLHFSLYEFSYIFYLYQRKTAKWLAANLLLEFMLEIIKRSWSGLQGNLKKQAINYLLYKRYGLGWFNRKLLKHQKESAIRTHYIEDVKIQYKNGSELLHTIEDIFINEIYKSDMCLTPYIIDGGANIGLSVLYFLNKYPGATIAAFEPDTQNFNLLQTNTAGISEHLTIHKVALWKENGFVSFHNSGDMGSKIEVQTDSSQNVEAKRLRDLLTKKVDFLKLDIEGAEYEVLLDIEDKLDFVERMFLEYHGNFDENYKLTNILQILQKSGFKCYIKEAAAVYKHPFCRSDSIKEYDVQLNMFFFKS